MGSPPYNDAEPSVLFPYCQGSLISWLEVVDGVFWTIVSRQSVFPLRFQMPDIETDDTVD